jgi:hypothetical protein
MTLRESLATAKPAIPPRLPDLPKVAAEEENTAKGELEGRGWLKVEPHAEEVGV